MRESINPDVCRQRFRHAHRKFVIHNRHRRHELGIEDHHFHIPIGIGNDSDFRRFTARARRRRHRDERRPRLRNAVIALKPDERFGVS